MKILTLYDPSKNIDKFIDLEQSNIGLSVLKSQYEVYIH